MSSSPAAAAKVVLFNSEDDTPARSFELWRSRSFPSTASLMLVDADPDTFWTRREQAIFKEFSITKAGIRGMHFRRTPEQARRDGNDSIWIELAVSAASAPWSATERGEGRQGIGGIVVNDLSRWSERVTNDNEYIALTLNRDLVAGVGLQKLHGGGPSAARERMVGLYMKWLAAKAPRIVDEARLERMTVAVLALVAAGDQDYAKEAAPAMTAITLKIAQDYIDAHLMNESFSLTEIVAASGVSRATLYRLFKPFGGLAQFVSRRRAELAWQAVTNPSEHRRLGEISHILGYTNQSVFSRDFRQRFGVRPSDFRI